MKKIFAAAAAATMLAAGGAFAQATETEQPAEMTWDMHIENMTMLRSQVESEFARRGIDHPVGALSLDQLSEVFLILNNDSLTEDEAVAQVDRVIEGGQM